MKIHYISCHAILEYDEVKLLTELGHEVHSNGAYRDPRGAYTLPRPGIPEMKFDENFFNLTAMHPKTNLPPELIEPYDAFIFMHNPEALFANWERIKHKRVIFRSIGQSVPSLERQLKPLMEQGLQVVRYSNKEELIPEYAGKTTTIYFYKDPNEFNNWNGDNKTVINFTQSLKGRRDFVHHDEIMAMGQGYDFKVYGTGNDDLGALNGGEMPYEVLKQIMRNSRVYLYGGTWPACYTLALMEALMTGIPVVSIGKKLAEQRFEQIPFYEVHEIIQDGVNGFVSDDVGRLRQSIDALLVDHQYAKMIGTAGRQTAIEYFGKNKIKNQWREFLQM